MPKIQFIGRVLPNIFAVSLPVPELTWTWPERNLEVQFRGRIANSFVNIECELERYELAYFPELYRHALHLARSATNMIAFATGRGLTVMLETLIDPEGVPSPIIPLDPSVLAVCTAFGLEAARQADFNAVFQAVMTEPPLFRALDDLAASLTAPGEALNRCGRAIEGVRQMIAPTLERGPGWNAMQQALNVSRPYLEWISKQSAAARNAEAAPTTAKDVTRRAWAIMNRFLDYRKRGSKPLTAPEFPLLQ